MRGPRLVVRVSANGLARDRWGFAVGRRLAPLAHDRNRVRRRLREAARAVAAAGGERGRDVVVVAREGALSAGVAELGRELARLLAKAERELAARETAASRTSDGSEGAA